MHKIGMCVREGRERASAADWLRSLEVYIGGGGVGVFGVLSVCVCVSVWLTVVACLWCL